MPMGSSPASSNDYYHVFCAKTNEWTHSLTTNEGERKHTGLCNFPSTLCARKCHPSEEDEGGVIKCSSGFLCIQRSGKEGPSFISFWITSVGNLAHFLF